MNIQYGAILLAGAAFLTGCSGFWAAPPASSTTTTTPTTLSSGPFYVLNQTAAQVAAYTISSGALTSISEYSPSLGVTINCIAVAPGGKYFYVGTNSGIYAYSINPNGGLVSADSIAISPDIPLAMQVSPNGSWLIDAFINLSTQQVQLNAIPLNSSGVYLAGANIPSVLFTVSNPAVKQMVLSPQADYLFLALGSGGAVVLSFVPGSSSSPFGTRQISINVAHSNQAVLSVAVDPTERLFYLGETNADTTGTLGALLAFNYSSLSGTPAQISGSPIASGGLSPSAILPEASGSYVYVANGQGASGTGNITWFSVTAAGTAYSIAAGSNNSIASGVFPVGLAEDNSHQFVLAVSTGGSTSSGDPDLEAYTMSSGALTSSISSKTGNDPVGASAVAALP